MTDARPLWERCSLMAGPGGPPPPKERPPECPEGAAYVAGGRQARIFDISPDVPLILVTVPGERKRVAVMGGKGDDRLMVGDEDYGSSSEGRQLVAGFRVKMASPAPDRRTGARPGR